MKIDMFMYYQNIDVLRIPKYSLYSNDISSKTFCVIKLSHL